MEEFEVAGETFVLTELQAKTCRQLLDERGEEIALRVARANALAVPAGSQVSSPRAEAAAGKGPAASVEETKPPDSATEAKAAKAAKEAPKGSQEIDDPSDFLSR